MLLGGFMVQHEVRKDEDSGVSELFASNFKYKIPTIPKLDLKNHVHYIYKNPKMEI